MTLPSTGAISLNAIKTEFGGSTPVRLSDYYKGGQYVTLNNSSVPSSGTISLSNFYGASKIWSGTITTNQTNFNFYTWATANGYSGTGPAQITVAAGVYIYATVNYFTTYTGDFPDTLYIINNGYILGAGGTGGGYDGSNWLYPTYGGTGLQLTCNTIIDSSVGYIAGGGGGGGNPNAYASGGGGAGGGSSGRLSSPTTGAAGGGPGSSGSAGSVSNNFATGGGGGRIVPGNSVTGPTATGSGGNKAPAAGFGGQGGGSGAVSAYDSTATGGTGSGGNNPGGAGSGFQSSGGGGGWGAAGGNAGSTGAGYNTGAAGGVAINTSGGHIGNQWTLTWYGGFPTGHILGSVI